MQISPSSPPPRSSGWSIHSRLEITDKYDILDRVGSGAYSDVYRGRRRSDGLAVALKEVHDHQSAAREADALRALRGCPNVISLLDCFWRDDDAVVFVLEFLHTDLAAIIRDARRSRGGCGGGGDGIPAAEVKRWMLQILEGVDACHRSFVLHRDLKPANLLVSDDGVLKLADFGQSRILLPDSTFDSVEDPENHSSSMVLEQGSPKQHEPVAVLDQSFSQHSTFSIPEKTTRGEAVNTQDGNASVYATSKSAYDDYELDNKEEEHLGDMTSCVGTRWYRAPELLYGSERYGTEIDLWSLGCIFAELLSLQPMFPGESDIDQLSRIINVLGDLNEETWSGCSTLPDYGKIFFGKVESALGLESCLPNRSASEVSIVKRLVCYEPLNRATAGDLIQDKYFNEEPLPIPANELRVPPLKDLQDDDSPTFWSRQNDSSDSDFEYGGFDVSNTSAGFSIRFS